MEVHAVGDAVRGGVQSQAGIVGAGSVDVELEVVRQPGQCLDHDGDPLAPLEPADVAETELPLGRAVPRR